MSIEKKRKHLVVIGAGVGGLTTAALCLQAGYKVTVLEAHVYPGGSAGTFYHKGYRFDAGATLAGGFSAGGPHARLAEQLGLVWPISPVDPAWAVHMPDGRLITQWADPAKWEEEWRTHFPGTERFWRTQQLLADVSWGVSSRPFPWPPELGRELWQLIRSFRPELVRVLPYVWRKVVDLIPAGNPDLKLFLDAQLLIAAQAISDGTNALYGSAALDLPRRGVNHIHGGIGGIAKTLVAWIRENGGEVLYRQKVEKIRVDSGRVTAVHTNKKLTVEGDEFVANVTPWALADLLGDATPTRLRDEVEQREDTWGAFALYLGLDGSKLPTDLLGHQQIVVDPNKPLGEGNSVFFSLSDGADGSRAPAGYRNATLSTHTRIAPWWELRQQDDPSAYHERRDIYAERLLTAVEKAIPNVREAITLCLPGTPVTFEFYTRRPGGMVGGFPQSSLFTVRGPSTGIPNLRLVGDSIFPGQSTAGVTIGGMRVADSLI